MAAVNYMNECLRAGTAFAETSPNCLVIHYEAVVADPLLVANRMYRFIGVQEREWLDLENGNFETPSGREKSEWRTPETLSGEVRKDRVGAAEQQLNRGDWDFVCAKTIRHPLVTERYSIPSLRWTIAARLCVARCLALRIKEGAPTLWTALCRRLTQ
jgi:hypothetical protein